jgi:hypothetical protein
MKIIRNLFIGLLSICALVVVLLPPFSEGQEQEKLREEFHQIYGLSANGRLSLENINGGVRIIAWDKAEVKVDAVKIADTQEKLQNLEIQVDSSADSIRIRTKYPETMWRGERKERNYNNPGSVEYTLTVPRGARIASIELINGDLDMSGLSGEVKASTINGRFTAKGLSGDCKLSTINGSMEVVFDNVGQNRSISLNSVNAKLDVSLPSDLNARVKANTVHGNIKNDFNLPVRKGEWMGQEMDGVLGSGGARISVSNVNGSILIRRNNDGRQISNATSYLSAEDEKNRGRGEGRGEGGGRGEYEDWDDMDEYVDAVREAQNAVRDAQREVAQAKRDVARAMREMERAKQRAENINDEETKEAIKEAEAAKKEAERELEQAMKEVERAKLDAERAQEKHAREAEKIRVEMQKAREAMRAVNVEKIKAETERAVQEAMNAVNAVNVANAINYGNNLRVVAREAVQFMTKGAPRINATTFDGQINVRSWDKNEVSCALIKRAQDEKQIKGIRFSAHQNGNEIVIKTDFDNAYARKFKGGVSINAIASLEINVPRNATLKINSGDGRLRIKDVSGDIEATTGDGGVEVRDCNGRLKIDTGDGRIYVTNHQGEATVNTGDGNITLEGRFTKLSAETGDGNIVLGLPSNTNATIEAESESMNVDGLKSTEESGGNDRLKRWKLGSGSGPVFKLRAGDGRVSVRRID